MYKTLKPLACLMAACALSMSAQARTITYNNSPAAKEQYLAGLLQLALDKSGSDYQAQPLDEELSNAKARAELEGGGLDVYWLPANKENEETFTPIRIPLIKGLLGYRVFLIKEGNQYKFDGITTLEQLKRLTGGLGRTWGDTPIMENAGLPLETTVKYESLFYMLEGERFDYFPRAGHEPWSEIEAHPQLGLTVEKNILLLYPLAMYFYVNKSEAELARVIEKGLEVAIADGSFNDYFYSNPLIQSALNESNLKSRRIIRIDNPYLSDETPLWRKELWLNLDELP